MPKPFHQLTIDQFAELLASFPFARRIAAQHLPWWRANNIYPIFFVWETGVLETLIQLFGQRRARDLEEVSARVLQTVARNIGGVKIWSGMKVSAERSTDDPDGGALYVAQKLTTFLAKHNTGERESVEALLDPHQLGDGPQPR